MAGQLLPLLVLAQALGCLGKQKQYPVLGFYNASVPPTSVQLPLATSAPFGQTAQERAEALRPLAWLHVPKDGSTFLNTIINNPTVCPSMPPDSFLPASSEFIYWGTYQGQPNYAGAVPHVIDRYPFDVYCPGGWSNSFSEWSSRNHFGIGGPAWKPNEGRIVTMLRQPEQRLISAFNMHLDPHMYGWQLPLIKNLSQYAHTWQGCLVKMIVYNHTFGPCFNHTLPPPTAQDSQLAVRRLRTGFAFIGILEEWELSVCLFHAMFGGWCYDREFSNMRKSSLRNSSHSLYNTSGLNGWTDPWDGPVYNEAMAIFNESLVRYRVPRQNCREICRPPPGH